MKEFVAEPCTSGQTPEYNFNPFLTSLHALNFILIGAFCAGATQRRRDKVDRECTANNFPIQRHQNCFEIQTCFMAMFLS